MRWLSVLSLVTALWLGAPSHVAGQDAPAASDFVRIFFDCPQAPGCRDPDFFRREVGFVSWVLDREASDVHVLVTSQATGGGGQLYTLAFLGVGSFEGVDHELDLSTSGDATVDEQRSAIAERLKLGLVRYAQTTSAADQLRVTWGAAGEAGGGPPGPGGLNGLPPGLGPQDDPWDFWVFRINGNGFVNGEASSRFSNYFGQLEASRTTEAWKLSARANYSKNVQRFEIPATDGSVTVIRETRKDWGASGLAVRSVGGQWAVGVRADLGSSTLLNQDHRLSVQPGVEYNFLPYVESSRRSLTLQYLLGPVHYDYREPTIFAKTSESLAQQSLTARLALVQPWGRWTTSVTGSQFLHDPSKYNVSVFGSVNVRLFRGFSVRINGNYSWIRDQLYLSAEGATDEQILLRQRQLATSYRYFTSFGIEYRFGSIFNNVVNPRFGGEEVFFF
jgi:hypothetical protein